MGLLAERKTRRPHWYFISVHECPICGRTETFRERRYGRKPKSWKKTHEYFQTSGCGSHFL